MVQDRKTLRLDVETYTLPNGLRVILHPDRSTPIVAVNLWYHVGSKDESPTLTGLAHLFEHLMFEGSANYDNEYFKPLQEAGGSVNGSTSNDRTNYYEVVPSNFLELALWMEADRMGNLLPALTQAKLDNQRSVVKNERRQRVENQPYGMVSEAIGEALYPAEHPYSWPVIGSMDHLDTMSLDDVHQFFRTHYRPSNASLAISGSFDSQRTRRWIEHYFGAIGENDVSPRVALPLAPNLREGKRIDLEDGVALPRLDLVWPTIPRFNSDEPALDFAAAILAGHSKDSRLKRRLIHEEKLVTGIGAFHHTMQLAGQFVVRTYGLPKTDLDRVRTIALEEIAQLAASPPTREEVAQVRSHYLNEAYSQVETILGKANTLNHYLFYQGAVTPDCIAKELRNYEAVTASDIQAAVQKYLGAANVTVTVLPTGGARKQATPHIEAREKETINGKAHSHQNNLPGGGPTPSFQLPAIQRMTAPNGLKILLVERHQLPRIEFQLLHTGGSAREGVEQLGLARLTADVLDESSESRSGLELARAFDRLGARIGISSGVETGVAAFRTLSDHLAESFALFSEVLLQPRFAQQDFDRERERLAAELAHRSKQPSALADDAIDSLIFGGEHPYGRPTDGTVESIHGISTGDLRDFYSRTHLPATAQLVVVGPVSLPEVADLLDREFSRWQGGDEQASQPIAKSTNGSRQVVVIERPDAPQSVLRVGKLAVARNSPDYFPLLLLNMVLGGQFASRLNLNLREEKGYTYGARSSFHLRRHGGAFTAGADVQGVVTRDAVREMLREIVDLARDKPVTEEELEYAKAYLCRRFPARFETSGGIAAHLAQLAIFGLADDYFDHYLTAVESVSLDQVNDAAQRHFSPAGMHVVVVGEPHHAEGLEKVVRDILGD